MFELLVHRAVMGVALSVEEVEDLVANAEWEEAVVEDIDTNGE